MTIKYEKFTPTSYDHERGEEFGDTETFEYEIDNDDLKAALTEILKPNKIDYPESRDRTYICIGIESVLNSLDDCDLLEKFAEYYEEDLKDHFESDAFEWYEG